MKPTKLRKIHFFRKTRILQWKNWILLHFKIYSTLTISGLTPNTNYTVSVPWTYFFRFHDTMGYVSSAILGFPASYVTMIGSSPYQISSGSNSGFATVQKTTNGSGVLTISKDEYRQPIPTIFNDSIPPDGNPPNTQWARSGAYTYYFD